MNGDRKYILDKPFALESGRFLDKVTIAYNTYGELNEDRDNVIVICHALSANSDAQEWWPDLFGPGRIYDPTKFFILCANNLGSPYGTTSPLSSDSKGNKYGLDFPFFTIRDTANLYLQFLKEKNIKKIHLLIGGSCGGSVALEMAMRLSDSLSYMALLCCSKQEMPWVVAIHESQRIALFRDKTFKSKNPEAGKKGLYAARAIAMPFYRHPESLNKRQKEESNDIINNFKAASYINYQGKKFADRFDAHCYYHLLNALDSHNVARGYDSFSVALSLIKAKTLVLGFSTDILIPPSEQEELADLIPHGESIIIKTIFGHDAFLIETDAINEAVVRFLNN